MPYNNILMDKEKCSHCFKIGLFLLYKLFLHFKFLLLALLSALIQECVLGLQC